MLRLTNILAAAGANRGRSNIQTAKSIDKGRIVLMWDFYSGNEIMAYTPVIDQENCGVFSWTKVSLNIRMIFLIELAGMDGVLTPSTVSHGKKRIRTVNGRKSAYRRRPTGRKQREVSIVESILGAIMRETGSKRGCSRDSTWPVDGRPAGRSPYGVLDTGGNVKEWTSSWSATDKRYRMSRGGSWG